MARIANKSKSPFKLKMSGGQIAFIRGHVSKSDESIKDRKFQVSTHAGKRQQVADYHALNDLTAMDIHRLIVQKVGVSFPITAVSAAFNTLSDRVADRINGKTQSGPKVTIPVAVDSDGRTVIQAIQNQKTGEWSLSLGPVEQVWTKTIKAGTVDHKAEEARKLEKCTAAAVKQSDKWMAQATKTQSLSSLCALINKVIPQPKGTSIRSFTLIGNRAIKCESVSIGGQVFTDMLSMVVAFRPDLIDLFKQTKDQANG